MNDLTVIFFSSAHSFALLVDRSLRSLSSSASLPLHSAFRQFLAVPPSCAAEVFSECVCLQLKFMSMSHDVGRVDAYGTFTP